MSSCPWIVTAHLRNADVRIGSEVAEGPRRQRSDPERRWRNTIRPVGAGNVMVCEGHDDVLSGPMPTNIVVVSNLVCAGAADETVLLSAREGMFPDAAPDRAIDDTRVVPGKVVGGAFAGTDDTIPRSFAAAS
jgi:hypothetical protein